MGILDFVVWNVSPDIISSPVNIRWYGLMFAIGFLAGTSILGRIYRHEGAPERWVGILLIWVVCATMIGARLGHVFFYEWAYYSQHPLEIFKIWEGGLASHGGTIAIIIAVLSIFAVYHPPQSDMDIRPPGDTGGSGGRPDTHRQPDQFGNIRHCHHPALGLHVPAVAPVARNVLWPGLPSDAAL